MKPTLFFIFLHVFCIVSGQSGFRTLANGYNRDFNSQEISDSGFTSVEIYTLYSDHIGDENWRDTLYEAKFNKQGKVIFQKIKNSIYDSTISYFFYSDKNYLERKVVKEYSMIVPDKTSIDTIDYDKEGKVLKHSSRSYAGKTSYASASKNLYNKSGQRIKTIETGDKNAVTEYFYTKSGKEERYVYTLGKTAIAVFNEYDMRDSLVKVKAIESYEDKSDSTISVYVYNDLGKLIRKSRYPSSTYYKTFSFIDCSTGDRYDEIYNYDSIGRKIYEASALDTERILYTSVACTKTKYYDFGSVTEVYDSKRRLFSTSVYNYYTGYEWGKRYLRESYNLTSRTTTFLSEESKLILSIDISQNQSDGNEKYLYVYNK